MEGGEILDHFWKRLQSIEAATPSLRSVRRLEEAPQSMQELHHFRSSYEGEPVVFPASWAPSWQQCLGASSAPEGLTNLLTNVVEIETFRLTYARDGGTLAVGEASAEICTDNYADRTSNSPTASLGCQTLNEQKKYIFHDGHGVRSEEADSRQSQNPKVYIMSERCTCSVEGDNCSWHQLGREAAATSLQPIPTSTVEHMDFGSFVTEALELMNAPKNQLLYLSWRGLPDTRQSSGTDEIPKEFTFFMDNLLLPTTTPPFLPVGLVKQRNMWMGSIVTSQIHFDALDNLHVCISNQKVFHLYSPLELRNMHPKPWNKNSLNNFSSIESILSAKAELHHNFFNVARYIRAEVKEGEAIYIPAGWWHEVFTLKGMTLSANVWFSGDSKAQFRPTLMHLKSGSYYLFMKNRGHEYL